MAADTSGDTLGRAALTKEVLDPSTESLVSDDLHSLELCLLSSDVRFLYRFLRIVDTVDGVSCDLIGDGGGRATHASSNGTE